MEFRSVVFNAARDGKLRRLKVFLEHRPKEEVKAIVSSKVNGATPLVMAARNGHLEVAEYLLEKCTADLEQVGSVTFDGEIVEGAPPLWCAAAAGYLAIVKLLIKHGANINATTKTNSTALRAACFDGHFEVVKFLVENGADIEIANRHGHTCLMIACYKGHYDIANYLIQHGAQVDRKSVKGNTALHDCAESGSLEIMKLLIAHNAKMDVDSYGMTPLLAAALTGHTNIVELIISMPSLCTRKEKIDALELLGATYVDKKRDMLGALKFWKRAMAERQYTLDMSDRHCAILERQYPFGASSIVPSTWMDSSSTPTPTLSAHEPSIIVIEKPHTPPNPAYDNAVEVRTMAELEELVSDPDAMRMQALLIRERILGPAHPDTSYYIRYRGAVYADTGNFERCIRLWMYALEMQQRILEPLSPMTQSSLLSFAELFGFMMTKSLKAVRFDDLFAVFQHAFCELQSALIHFCKENESCPSTSTSCSSRKLSDQDVSALHRACIICLHLLALLCRLLMSHMTYEQEMELKRAVYKLVKLNPRGKAGFSLLHLACHREHADSKRAFPPLCDFPLPEVAKLLLECGASPNQTDYKGNTPLHIVANTTPCPIPLFKTLVQAGGHIDMRNKTGESPLELLLQNPFANQTANICPLQHLTLKCLSAQAVARNHLLYIGLVPKKLEEFIATH